MNTTTDKQLREAVKSLLSDIDAQRCPAPETIIDEESDLDHWFGAFSFCHYDDGGDGYVQWPNLSIMAEKLRSILDADQLTGRGKCENVATDNIPPASK